MILVDLPQGGEAWKKLRLGVVTASQADRIVTRSGTLSGARHKYKRDLLTEWVTGQPADEFSSEWTEYGKAMEPRAREFYELLTDREVTEVGFIYKDESRLVGGSPDGMTGPTSDVEIKCPSAKIHMGYWLDKQEGLKEHKTQMQFRIWCGMELVDFVSFHPELPPVHEEVTADDKMQDAFSKHVPVFLEELAQAKERLIAEGYGPQEEAA